MAFLKKFFNFPSVRADDDDEIVDPQQVLREKCLQNNGQVSGLHDLLQQCNNRVNSRKNTAETCFEELVDYLTELDKCVGKDLFSQLK